MDQLRENYKVITDASMDLGRITKQIKQHYKYIVTLCKIYEMLKTYTTLGLINWSWGQKWRRPRAERTPREGVAAIFGPRASF